MEEILHHLGWLKLYNKQWLNLYQLVRDSIQVSHLLFLLPCQAGSLRLITGGQQAAVPGPTTLISQNHLAYTGSTPVHLGWRRHGCLAPNGRRLFSCYPEISLKYPWNIGMFLWISLHPMLEAWQKGEQFLIFFDWGNANQSIVRYSAQRWQGTAYRCICIAGA